MIAHPVGSVDALLEAALVTTIDDSVADLDLWPASGRVDDFAKNLVSSVGRVSDDYAFQYQVMPASRLWCDGRGHLRLVHSRHRAILRSALDHMGVPATDGVVEPVYAALEGVVVHQVVHVEDLANERAVAALRLFLRTMTAHE